MFKPRISVFQVLVSLIFDDHACSLFGECFVLVHSVLVGQPVMLVILGDKVVSPFILPTPISPSHLEVGPWEREHTMKAHIKAVQICTLRVESIAILSLNIAHICYVIR